MCAHVGAGPFLVTVLKEVKGSFLHFLIVNILPVRVQMSVGTKMRSPEEMRGWGWACALLEN